MSDRSFSVVWVSVAMFAHLFALGCASALATSSGSLTIQPQTPGRSSLFYRTRRGETARGSFLVRNPTARRQRVTLYGLDASVDGRSKVFSVGAKNAPQTGVGSWLRLGSSTVVLKPNGKRRIGFMLSIPKVTKPGPYAGAILAEGPAARPPSGRPAAGGREQLLIVERVGLRVYVDVPASSTADLALALPRIEESRWTTPATLWLLGVRRGRRVSLAARVSNGSEHPRRDLTVHAEVLLRGTLVSSTDPQPVGLVSAHGARDVHIAVSYSGWSRHGYRTRVVVSGPSEELVSERILQPAWGVAPLNVAAAVTVIVFLLLIVRRCLLRWARREARQ